MGGPVSQMVRCQMCNQEFPNEQELQTHNRISHAEEGIGKTVGGNRQGQQGKTGGGQGSQEGQQGGRTGGQQGGQQGGQGGKTGGQGGQQGGQKKY